jgi:NB-ARC domain
MANYLNYAEQAAVEWNLDKLHLDLAKAKENIHPHKKRGLTPTERLHLQGLLSGYSPLEIANQLVITPQGINVALSKTIYRYIETLTGHNLNSIENWREVVEWLDAAGYKNCASIDWGEAPDVSAFYGREQELFQLKQWILHDRCRLISILGIGGIGKTALSVALIEQIQNEFEYVIWRSLREPTSLENFLPKLLIAFPTQQPPLQDLSQLLQFLRDNRCLIILDQLEILLKDQPVGHYGDGYEEYGELLRRVGTERHNSCLLITSRDKPREFVLLEGKKNSIRSQMLGSLQGSAKGILKDKELLDNEDQWQKLIQLYGGNPLALKIVSETIQDLFGGSVNQFLKQNTTFIDSGFRELLDQQFSRLSEPEKATICQIAEYSHPISIKTLTEITSAQNSNLGSIEIIESLRRRSLLEKVKGCEDSQFTLHPIVAKYINKYILS